MYCLVDFCCICFNNKGHLQPLSDSGTDNITYFIKLTSYFSDTCFIEMNEQWLVCKKCCKTMDTAYKFRQKCIRSKTTLTDYISQHKFSNISGTINVYLTDINKFCDTKQEYQKGNKKIYILKGNKNINKQENSDINLVTEIKTENNTLNLKLIDTEHNHIQFENVVIDMKQEDQFLEENVEVFHNPLVNQDEIKPNDIQNDILTTSVIKKEIENLDIKEHLHERYENIMGTSNSANYDYSLQVEKNSDDPLTNIDESKLDIVHSNFVSVNEEINIQCKSEDIAELAIEDNINPLKDQDEVKANKEKKQKTFTTIRECSICQKKFSQLYHLKEHMKIHAEDKLHECSVCKKIFTFARNMREHMRTHTREKLHECNVCQKKFIRSAYLKEHTRIHTGEKPHECNVCQKKFTLLVTLMSHERIHTGEKPYECNLCEKKFTRLDTLIRHKRTHSGEKPYECDICQRKFSLRHHLSKHMKCHLGKLACQI